MAAVMGCLALSTEHKLQVLATKTLQHLAGAEEGLAQITQLGKLLHSWEKLLNSWELLHEDYQTIRGGGASIGSCVAVV